jgi:hypothetical protein
MGIGKVTGFAGSRRAAAAGDSGFQFISPFSADLLPTRYAGWKEPSGRVIIRFAYDEVVTSRLFSVGLFSRGIEP